MFSLLSKTSQQTSLYFISNVYRFFFQVEKNVQTQMSGCNNYNSYFVIKSATSILKYLCFVNDFTLDLIGLDCLAELHNRCTCMQLYKMIVKCQSALQNCLFCSALGRPYKKLRCFCTQFILESHKKKKKIHENNNIKSIDADLVMQVTIQNTSFGIHFAQFTIELKLATIGRSRGVQWPFCYPGNHSGLKRGNVKIH